MPPQVNRLDELKIIESSGVDRPANLADGWLVMKEDGVSTSAIPPNGGFYVSPPTTGTTLTFTYGSNTTAVAAAANPFAPHPYVNKTDTNGNRCDTCGKGETASMHVPGKSKKEAGMPPDFNRDELTPEALAYVADLEAKVAAAPAPVDPAAAPVAPATAAPVEPAAVAPVAPVAEPLDKAIPEAIRKELEDAKAAAAAEVAKNATLAEKVAKMELKERTAEFVNKAKDLPNIGGATEVGTLLLSISDKVEEATYKELERLLKAANAQLEKGALFTQMGDPGAAPTEGPLAEINKLAAAKLSAGQAATIEIAKAAVMQERPDLRNDYMAAQRRNG